MGAVVIGRNEGERLQRCLKSVCREIVCVVYVDSGSSDDSVAWARTSAGAEVVELDLTVPFTAARARNAGFERLIARWPTIRFVQFLDGDCELDATWLNRAREFLTREPQVAAVCGRRRERFPDRSRYNLLCDLEWNTPIGDTAACGGDALLRVEPFQQIGGFNPGIIAGEEPELGVRLRLAGWRIHRLDAEMTLHDADMTRFRQWWLRTKRAGHAYAEGSHLHGRGPLRHARRELRSIIAYAAILPLSTVVLAWPTRGLSLLLLLVYPLLYVRIARHMRSRGVAPPHARLYSASCVLGKFPQMLGALRFHFNRLRRRHHTLIEYKR